MHSTSRVMSTVPDMDDQAGSRSKLQAAPVPSLRPIAVELWNIEQVGYERLPDRRSGDPVPEPHQLPRLGVPDADRAAQHQLRRQGRVHGLVEDEVPLPGDGHDPDRPVGREKSQAALDAAEEVLERGELFGIFPEGTRSRDGDLYKGRTGAARLAMSVGCPIFPVGITGTDEIQPIDAKVPKLRKACTIEIGRPIRPERYRGRGPEHLAWRSMIDEIMFEIREMTGQTYHNHYAGRPTTERVEPVEGRHGRADDAADSRRHLVAV